MTPFIWHVEQVAQLRAQIRACERSAALAARCCPPQAIERYVRTCARVERQARQADMLVSVISAFGPPAIFLGFDGPIGIIAGMIFVAAWAFVGLDQCMTHIARVHARTIAAAASELATSATKAIA